MSKNLSAILRTGSSTPITIASNTQLGAVKVDGSTITINGSGVISSTGGSGTILRTVSILNRSGSTISVPLTSGYLAVLNRASTTIQVSIT
jgi:hypothetical protein